MPIAITSEINPILHCNMHSTIISPETRAKSAMVIHATLEIGSLKVHVTFNDGIATYKGFFN